jgi:hypothetical protein
MKKIKKIDLVIHWFKLLWALPLGLFLGILAPIWLPIALLLGWVEAYEELKCRYKYGN